MSLRLPNGFSSKQLWKWGSSPLKLTFLYLLIGIIWILYSDQAVLHLGSDPRAFTGWQTGKGLVYVGATAYLLYRLLRRNQRMMALQRRQSVAQARRKSDRQFRKAILNAPYPIIIHAEDGEVVQISQTWTEITGYTLAEIPTVADWTEKAYGHRKDLVRANIDRLYQLDTRLEEGEYTLTTAYGDTRIWDFSSAPLGRTAEGKRLVISMATDVTARKRTEQDLLERESRLALALDVAQIGTWDVDLVTGAIQESERMQTILGKGPSPVPPTYQAWQQQVHPDDLPRVQAAFETAIQTQTDYGTEYRLFWPDGSLRWISVGGKVLGNVRGEAIRAIGIGMDITEQKLAEQALEQRVQERTAQLQAANRELDSFAYSVSHDLRAPLRHISGFANVLAETLEQNAALNDPRVAHYLEVIQASSVKMGLLIDGLLNLSRVGRKPLERVPIQLPALVEQAIALVKTQLSPEAIATLQVTIHPLPTVLGDPILLQQVFTNLIDNAVKFSRNQSCPQVTIGAEPNGTLFIQDNGVGFEMKHADQLFGAFQRLHSKHDFEGTGIGLAIVQRIIHRHDGQIWAESAPQQGTTFYLRLGQSDTAENSAKLV